MQKKFFILLWICCVLASIAVLPYVHALGLIPSVDLKIFLLSLIQPAILFGIVCWVSYLLLKRVDIHPFGPVKPMILPGVIAGFIVGGVLVLLEKTLFAHSPLAATSFKPPAWAGFLASFYGGLNEEVLCRLFLATLIYFLFRKVSTKKTLAIWTSIIVAALIFAIGHTPALFKIMPSPSGFELFRILLLNTIPGIVFGWLYFRRGFFAGVFAHFVTDLMIHVFLR